MKYRNIREEEIKNKVAREYFSLYDCTEINGNVDFCVSIHQDEKGLFDQKSLLWAEAKTGSSDVYNSIVQLILTIGKARTFDKFFPPPMLGAFDGEKIAFVPYSDIHEIFYLNDFNWNVTPSNHSTKEFKLIYQKVKLIIDAKALMFDFINDNKELKNFIKKNFVIGQLGLTKTKIDKNNFMVIYNKWLQIVKPTIAVKWDVAKKIGIIDGDFYLADLLSQDNETLKEKLYVLLKKDHYELDRKLDESGMFSSKRTDFLDSQVAHTQFWNRYDRPPKKEYWDYIVERRDLLVPQDVRERKGSFFTPQIWVELSQKYLADALGDDWQDEYYVWDCAAGTGNLLAGLTNKYNIWASTLDQQDVEVIHDRIKNGANLLDTHVFQFDFLNDDFNQLPTELRKILSDSEKRKRLVVYINPPYAEHGNRTTISNHGAHKPNVARLSQVYEDFHATAGTATRELFAQFFLRIHKELPESILASFSTVKFINSQNFAKFRQLFKAQFLKGFICNANTFDNVKGNFPIGFSIWDLKHKVEIKHIVSDVIESVEQEEVKQKSFYALANKDFISSWLRKYYDKVGKPLGYLILPGVDMQQQSGVYFTIQPTQSDISQHKTAAITEKNLMVMSVYLAVRQCITSDWRNNKDQFLSPNDNWFTDNIFKNDCLAFSLFHGQNKVSSNDGVNNWIPFSEYEVNAKEKFDSNFMNKFILGNLRSPATADLFGFHGQRKDPLVFSPESQSLFDSGRELWKYYHEQTNINANASLYDIKEYFQGRNDQGKMRNKSSDETYGELIRDLRDKLRQLARVIEPKVYEYGFLKL